MGISCMGVGVGVVGTPASLVLLDVHFGALGDDGVHGLTVRGGAGGAGGAAAVVRHRRRIKLLLDWQSLFKLWMGRRRTGDRGRA